MLVNILAVGKIKEEFYRKACDEYIKRLGRFCKLKIIEVAETSMRDGGEKDIARIINEESLALCAKKKGLTIALDLSGEMVSSQNISAFISKAAVDGNSEITLMIGGSNGMSRELVKNCDAVFCFGKITYPHQLMRVVLLEQLYRAFMINCGADYHK